MLGLNETNTNARDSFDAALDGEILAPVSGRRSVLSSASSDGMAVIVGMSTAIPALVPLGILDYVGLAATLAALPLLSGRGDTGRVVFGAALGFAVRDALMLGNSWGWVIGAAAFGAAAGGAISLFSKARSRLLG
jgi:hypothetical protein